MLRGLARFLVGYDFFISYAYKDGSAYAAALEKKLSNLDFACFFDASELPPGEQLPTSLRRAIGRSKALVLVGTEGSINAPFVKLELSAALEKRKVIPIDLDGIRERVEQPKLRELPWVNEVHVSGIEGPSAAVLERISGYVLFTRRNDIMRRVVGAAATVFLVIALVAVWQWRRAVEQRRIAIFERDRALSQQLGSQSRGVLRAEPDLALLLAAEAVSRSVTFEARDALLSAIQSRPGLVRLLHDAGHVSRLRFSPDGSVLASSGSGGEVTVWDVASGSARARLQIPDSAAASRLEFDRKGRLLAAYRGDDRIVVWDVTSRGSSAPPPSLGADALFADTLPSEAVAKTDSLLASRVAALKRRGVEVRGATLSPDTRILVTTDSREIHVWAPSDSVPIGLALSAQAPYVRTLAFAPNGLLASGSSAGTIALWDLGPWLDTSRVSYRKELPELTVMGRRLLGLETSANSLAFTPDGKTLAGGDYNGRIVLWPLDSAEAREPRSLEHGSNTGTLRFATDSRTLASYSGSQVSMWNVELGTRLRDIPLTLDRHVANFAPDLATAALGGNSGEITLLNLATGQSRALEGIHRDRLLALAFSPDGRTLASAGNGRRIALVDVASGQTTDSLDGHSNPVVDLAFSADGSRLASYDSDGTLIVWDVAARQPVGRPLKRATEYSATSAMALSPDGRVAVTSGPDGSLSLWDVETWRPLGGPLGGHTAQVVVIRFSADGRWMASGGVGGSVYLWDLRPESWATRACTMANRSLMPNEKTAYLVVVADDGKDACERIRTLGERGNAR